MHTGTQDEKTRTAEFQQKIGRLIGLLLTKSVFNPKDRKEIEEVLGGISLGEDVLGDRGVIEDIVKDVIEDVFGHLIKLLPDDEKLKLQVKIDQSIKSEISRFARLRRA